MMGWWAFHVERNILMICVRQVVDFDWLGVVGLWFHIGFQEAY